MSELSEQQVSEPQNKITLDPESAVLHALAILQHEEAILRWQNDSQSVAIEKSTNHIKHRYNRIYRQLGKAVDEATGLDEEISERRRENLMVAGIGVGIATVYLTIGGPFIKFYGQ